LFRQPASEGADHFGEGSWKPKFGEPSRILVDPPLLGPAVRTGMLAIEETIGSAGSSVSRDPVVWHGDPNLLTEPLEAVAFVDIPVQKGVSGVKQGGFARR
jgi:hypothetical protein